MAGFTWEIRDPEENIRTMKSRKVEEGLRWWDMPKENKVREVIAKLPLTMWGIILGCPLSCSTDKIDQKKWSLVTESDI